MSSLQRPYNPFVAGTMREKAPGRWELRVFVGKDAVTDSVRLLQGSRELFEGIQVPQQGPGPLEQGFPVRGEYRSAPVDFEQWHVQRFLQPGNSVTHGGLALVQGGCRLGVAARVHHREERAPLLQ